jgi:RNA polymerase sigma-70 factor, ECF subfamily
LDSDFIEIYEEHLERVYGFLAYRVGSPADAEDLTQLTFERALAAWDRYDDERAGVTTWLIAIARNALIDHLRRRARSRTVSVEEVEEVKLPTYSGPEDEGSGLHPAVAAALDRLTPRERSVVALRVGADLRIAEIAAIMDLSVANAEQISSRAMRKLRKELEEGSFGGSGRGGAR